MSSTRSSKTGILLTNLGTPDAPTSAAVRRYLNEFLSDRRVVRIPSIFWQPLLKAIILPLRSPKSAKAYQSIWTEQGSPLLVHTQALAEQVQKQLGDENTVVRCAMRYGNPSIAAALHEFLVTDKISRLIVLPLYPQFSTSTTLSTFDKVSAELRALTYQPDLLFIQDYYDHPAYLAAISDSIASFWQTHGKPEKLLFSFHGLPQEFVAKGDPYQQQCYSTAHALAKNLELSDDEYLVTFQSRFGPATWLQPYTDKTLERLAQEGVANVHVVCPGFAADCLETLEEIQVENRAAFLDAGGQAFAYIPALNASTAHAECLVARIKQSLLN